MGFILSDDWNSWTLLWKVWQQGSRYGTWTVDEGLYVGLQKKRQKELTGNGMSFGNFESDVSSPTRPHFLIFPK